MNLLILVVDDESMSRFCSASNSGATFALAGSPWSLPNLPNEHCNALAMRETLRSS